MRILIISKFFAPERSIAAVRWTKIAKYLKKEHKYTIDVLTEQRNFDTEEGLPIKIEKDELLEADLKWIDQQREVKIGLVLKMLFMIRNKFHKNSQYTESLVYLQKKHVGIKGRVKKSFIIFIQIFIDYLWSRQAIKQLREIDLSQWDAVVSSCGPFWVHRAAEYIKKRNRDIIWIADFRDEYPSPLNTKFFFNVEKRQANTHCRAADYVFKVNDSIYVSTPNYIKTKIITNGFDEEEAKSPKKPDRFNLVYTGSMYCHSDITPLLKVINDLTSSGRIEDGEIHIDIYGGRKELIASQIQEYNADRFYTHHGYVDRNIAMNAQQSAAILIQMGRNDETSKVGWSGKMYEYMMSGKPVIFMVSGNVPNSIPARYINKIGGYCYEQCCDEKTYEGLKDYIYNKYLQWKETGDVKVDIDHEYVGKYSYSSIASQIDYILREGGV